MPAVETSDGARIESSQHGDGRSLVLIHGITESRATWDPLLDPLLDAGYGITVIDLRGHGASSDTAPYDLLTLAGDVAAVLEAGGIDDPLLVGHSLGGTVVSACAATGVSCRGVINVDQPLRLGDFQTTLRGLEPALRGTDEEFQAAIAAIFDAMAGRLAGTERARVAALRRADQDVVLGIWDRVLNTPLDELEETIEAMVRTISAPYLSLHGIDPGPGYEPWLQQLAPQAIVEVWNDLGHYPHLVDRERFVARVVSFDEPLGG